MRPTYPFKKLLRAFTPLQVKWYSAGLFLIGCAILSSVLSPLYGYDYDVPQMPLWQLTAWLVTLGLIFLLLPFLISHSVKQLKAEPKDTAPTLQQQCLQQPSLQHLLYFILAIGLLARLILFFSTPALEDDFQRYLWDGAVTAHGYNPYSINPGKIFHGQNTDLGLNALAEQSGNVLRWVNHKNLRTIYPPAAQGAFALAYLLKPWSLDAWRFIILMCEIGAIGFMLAILSLLGRSPLWIALYWWNPLVIKELTNSAHMDGLLVPFVLGAVYFSMKQHYKTSTVFIFIATAIKIWPVLLLPLLLRGLWPDWRKILAFLSIFTIALGLMLSPILIAGLDQSSGFVAYVQSWQTNSAFFPAFNAFWQSLASPFNFSDKSIGLFSRLLIALIIGLTAIGLAWRHIENQQDILIRVILLSTILFLLSPAQFPWYSLWVLPFSVFIPVFGLLMLTALLPLYYLGFYLMAQNSHAFFASTVVWIIWLPIWGALLLQYHSAIKAKASSLGLKIMSGLGL